MTVLLRKEIRSLLPAWVLTLAATALIAFVRFERVSAMLFPIAIGSLILGITSFGSEFSHGTFSLLLAQPIPRNKIWRTKTIVLGAALLSIAVVMWVASVCALVREGGGIPAIHAIRLVRAEDLEMPLVFTVVLFGAAFAGGLLSALATRQMATAFWIALLFPAAVSGFVVIFTMDRSEKTIAISIATALVVYDLLAFLLARHQFLRAQDLPGAAGTTISLPAWMSFGAKARNTTATPLHRPVRALIAKEIQLHQVTLCFGAALLVLHVIVVFIRRMLFIPGGTQKEIYEILGTFSLLWFVLPVMIAGAAVAEERRQGTLESSICLPARQRTQWFIKCLVCFVLAIFLGGVMPWLVETVANLIGPPSPVFVNPSVFGDLWHFLSWTASVAAVATLVGFYASSLSRGLLQAVGVAVLIASSLGWFLIQVMNLNLYYSHENLLTPRDLLPFWMSLVALFIWLSYVNFKHPTVSRRLWLQNVLVLLFVGVLVYGAIVFSLAMFAIPRA